MAAAEEEEGKDETAAEADADSAVVGDEFVDALSSSTWRNVFGEEGGEEEEPIAAD